jgi:uncharacterized protein
MVAYSSEAFDSFFNAALAAHDFKEIANRCRYEVYANPAGSHRWRARARSGETVAVSGEWFKERGDAEQAADTVRTNAGTAAGP